LCQARERSPINDEILFPTDGSDGAAGVYEHVLDRVADTGATLHVINIVDTATPSLTTVGGRSSTPSNRRANRSLRTPPPAPTSAASP